MDKLSFENIIEMQIEMLKETRKKLIESIKDKKNKTPEFDGLIIKTRGGIGRKSEPNNAVKNDRRMYCWIECQFKGKEYDINLFHSEIDKDSGNCHCQIGKIMFTKGYVKNSSSVTSPNIIWEGRSDKEATTLIFNSYKWEDPLAYFSDKDSVVLANGLFVSVDDVLKEEDDFASKIADAFFDFIESDRLNVPKTYWEYGALNGFGFELFDENALEAEKYYNELAYLLNQFSIMQIDEIDELAKAAAISFDLSKLMKLYVENNRVSKQVADQLMTLVYDKILPLGVEYSFLYDVIIELFLF